MGNKLDKIKIKIDKDMEAGYKVFYRKFGRVKATFDKDLEAGYQVLDKKIDEVKITIDKDFDKFMKSIAFFQR